jgi:hypothetical protein
LVAEFCRDQNGSAGRGDDAYLSVPLPYQSQANKFNVPIASVMGADSPPHFTESVMDDNVSELDNSMQDNI